MTKPATPDEYLAALEPARRARLEEIRAAVRAACPEATEDMLYAMPGFRLGRSHLAAYAAAKHHDGFYPCSGGVIAQHPEVQARFTTSSGAVRFPLDAAVPVEVVGALVRTRIAEISARG